MTQDMKLMEFAFRMGQGSIQPSVAPSVSSGPHSPQIAFPALAEKPLAIPTGMSLRSWGWKAKAQDASKRCDR